MPGASAGQVQTVLGAVPASDLGITLPHEHLLLDLRRVFVEPEAAEELLLAHAPVGLENLSWVMMNWCRCRDNLVLDDPELAIEEAMRFKHAGGGTIVDVTSVGLGRRPAELRRIALSTGLHVVMGASYYYAFFHPPGTAEKSEEVLCEEIVTDLTGARMAPASAGESSARSAAAGRSTRSKNESCGQVPARNAGPVRRSPFIPGAMWRRPRRSWTS